MTQPLPVRLIPKWVDDPAIKINFEQALKDCGGARAHHLAEILATHGKSLRFWTWHLGLDDFFLILISSKDTDLLRTLGEAHNFPRGYPIIWKPSERLHLFGFYPKFKNDEMYHAAPIAGVERLSLSIKWSGFLFALLAFHHNGCDYWIVTSKNSGNCCDSGVEDFTQLAADVLSNELGDKLPATIRILARSQTYLCGECMSMKDQGHGYAYKKDAAVVTCAGRYDNQYEVQCPNRNVRNLLMHLPPGEVRAIAQECKLRCIQTVEVPAKKVASVVAELEKNRDFLTTLSLMELLKSHGLPVEQFEEHDEVIASNTVEGLVMQYQYRNKASLRVKWKLPRYTLVTMLIRQVYKEKISGHALVDLCTSTAKRWSLSHEGCKYYTMFGMVACDIVKQLHSGGPVAPWIAAAERVFAMDKEEVMQKGCKLVAEAQKVASTMLSDATHVLDIQKHDSMGCAVVTLASAEDVERLTSNPKICLGESVYADAKQHFDRATKQPCATKLFLAWGRQQELRSPISVEKIIEVLEESLGCAGAGAAAPSENEQYANGPASVKQPDVCSACENHQTDNSSQARPPQQLRLILAGLMGSGKSTLAQNLKDVLGGRIIAQDEFTNLGKDARRLCFAQEVEAAANNREVKVLIMDRVNTLQQQRTELAEALKNSCLPGKTVLIQMRHPEHRGQLAGDLAVQLCMERITHRGSNHNSLLGTRQNLKAILSCTSRRAELPDLAESSTFDQCICVDMTLPALDALSHVLQELQSNRTLDCNQGRDRDSAFCFQLPSKKLPEAYRSVRLHVQKGCGAGLDLVPTKHGMLVEKILEHPGQPLLRTGDYIVSITSPSVGRRCRSRNLRSLDADSCSSAFGEVFEDGASLRVESWCEISGRFKNAVDMAQMQTAIDNFNEKHDLSIGVNESQRMIHFSGPQSAVLNARFAVESLIVQYVTRA